MSVVNIDAKTLNKVLANYIQVLMQTAFKFLMKLGGFNIQKPISKSHHIDGHKSQNHDRFSRF